MPPLSNKQHQKQFTVFRFQFSVILGILYILLLITVNCRLSTADCCSR